MSDRVITIVGGGASTVSLVDALLDGIAQHYQSLSISIFIIEKRSQFGRGLAYSEDCVTNLLNTKAGLISPFSNKPGHFYQWLQNNKNVWEDDFSDVNLHPDTFLPRPLFGLYLSHMVQFLQKRALEVGCSLTIVYDEATNICFAHDGRVVVSTKDNLAFPSDQVILSCGNGGSHGYKSLVGASGFYPSPYPIKRIVRLIDPSDRVSIIGTRLSAIDAAIGLASFGHIGSITMHSRTGVLPSVRGCQGRYSPRLLTRDRIKNHIAHNGCVRLDDFIEWTIQELHAAGEKTSVDLSDLVAKLTHGNPLERLLKEIEASQESRPWQAVLYATNSIIDLVWPAMPDEDKERFWPYLSWWMAYRVSIPLENAIKLVELMKSGQLTVVPGSIEVGCQEPGFFVETSHEGLTHRYDYDAVVLATGTPRDARQLDNILVQNILEQGIAAPCRFGGLRVSESTGALVNSSGYADERITVLGELTNGTFFFTSALEINARHAMDRAGVILKRLRLGKYAIEEVADLRRKARW